MPRKNNDIEGKRAEDEGDLGMLGNARVYLQLVNERVDQAVQLGYGDLLAPALEDIFRADQLIFRAQTHIRTRTDVERQSMPAPR
jgi:hypothetical protein